MSKKKNESAKKEVKKTPVEILTDEVNNSSEIVTPQDDPAVTPPATTGTEEPPALTGDEETGGGEPPAETEEPAPTEESLAETLVDTITEAISGKAYLSTYDEKTVYGAFTTYRDSMQELLDSK